MPALSLLVERVLALALRCAPHASPAHALHHVQVISACQLGLHEVEGVRRPLSAALDARGGDIPGPRGVVWLLQHSSWPVPPALEAALAAQRAERDHGDTESDAEHEDLLLVHGYQLG